MKLSLAQPYFYKVNNFPKHEQLESTIAKQY